ncbi:RecQ type DNA helicase [Schizosaccharomyces octosporus yFS286]|uniref:RecQ type DNA helicase n=1 Tax=Schizosaccharomyces octosporus (strain yFS286) TaxID=483514 RepID=S9Q6X7_SCHOY|nr:RecQ type DNA helicase [Schizosaccharomyces octosporus yFS286]EPX75398.1 RecQ type DNA helicase [Schizosaccharomyces octosporus yFS286]
MNVRCRKQLLRIVLEIQELRSRFGVMESDRSATKVLTPTPTPTPFPSPSPSLTLTPNPLETASERASSVARIGVEDETSDMKQECVWQGTQDNSCCSHESPYYEINQGLATYGLQILSIHAVSCVECGGLLDVEHVKSHMQNVHHVFRFEDEVENLFKQMNHIDLKSPSTVSNERSSSWETYPCIFGLPVLLNGYECTICFDSGGGFVHGIADTFYRHVRRHHGRTVNVNECMRRVSLQTVKNKSYQRHRYFKVDFAPVVGEDRNHQLDSLIDSWYLDRVDEDSDADANTNTYTNTYARKRNATEEYGDDNDSVDARQKNLLNQQLGWGAIVKALGRNWQGLIGWHYIDGAINSKIILEELIRYYYRGFQYLKWMMIGTRKCLQKEETTVRKSVAYAELHEALKLAFLRQYEFSESIRDTEIVKFLACLSLRDDGTSRYAYEISSFFAPLIYTCRLVAASELQRLVEEGKVTLSSIPEFHTAGSFAYTHVFRYISLGKRNIYDILYEANKIVRDVTRTEGYANTLEGLNPSRVLFRPAFNAKYTIVGSHINNMVVLDLSDLSHLYESMFSRLQLLLEELCFGVDMEKLLPSSLLQSVGDDINNSKLGYSFFKESVDIRMTRSVLLRTVLKNDELRHRFLPLVSRDDFYDYFEELTSILNYETKATKFNELLFCLVYISAGQPARAKEMVHWTLKNSKYKARELYLMFGRLMIYSRYDKTRNMKFAEKPIPRFLPESLSTLALRYYALVRPFQAFLSSVKTGNKQAAAVYTNAMFVVNGGKRLDSGMPYRIFPKVTYECLGKRWDFEITDILLITLKKELSGIPPSQIYVQLCRWALAQFCGLSAKFRSKNNFIQFIFCARSEESDYCSSYSIG